MSRTTVHQSSIRSRAESAAQHLTVSAGLFWIYIFFLLDFFLRLSGRIPGYGALRPTLLLVVIISASLFVQRDRFAGKAKDPIMQAALLLIFYIAVTLPLVEWPGSVLRNNLDTFVKAVVFLFFTALIVDTDKRLKIFLGVFVGCQVFRALEPLYLNITQGYWGGSEFYGEGRLAGAPADVINPNELGFVIVTAVPFLHYLLFQGNKKAKLLYLILMPLLLYALVLTLSRGAFIVLLVVAWMIFKESRHKLFLILVAICIAAFAWVNMSPTQQDRYLSIVDDDVTGSQSAQGRIGGMKQEFRLGLERPIVGHGLGTTPEAKFHNFGSTQASHNLYAELLIELGLLGAIIFLRFLWKIYKRFSDNRKRLGDLKLSDRDFYVRLNKALIAVFWMYVVYSINYWGLSVYYWYLFGGLAISLGSLVPQNNAEGEREGRAKPLRSVRPGRPIGHKPVRPGARA